MTLAGASVMAGLLWLGWVTMPWGLAIYAIMAWAFLLG